MHHAERLFAGGLPGYDAEMTPGVVHHRLAIEPAGLDDEVFVAALLHPVDEVTHRRVPLTHRDVFIIIAEVVRDVHVTDGVDGVQLLQVTEHPVVEPFLKCFFALARVVHHHAPPHVQVTDVERGLDVLLREAFCF